MDDLSSRPYVRSLSDDPLERAWHIAVRVMRDGRVVTRCRTVELGHRLEWRAEPPEVSALAFTCALCLELMPRS